MPNFQLKHKSIIIYSLVFLIICLLAYWIGEYFRGYTYFVIADYLIQFHFDEKKVLALRLYFVFSNILIVVFVIVYGFPFLKYIISNIYINRGVDYYSNGNYDEALLMYQKALAIKESNKGKVDERDEIATIYNNIGLVFADRGEYDEALDWYQKSLVIKEKSRNQVGIASSYNNIGNIHNYRSEYDEALEWFQKSLTIEEKLGNRKGIANSYNNIGLIYSARGKYDEALDWYQKALAINEELGNRVGVATNCNQIGNIHNYRSEYDEALEWHQKSLAIERKLGNREGVANSYHNSGMIHSARGKYDEALNWYQKALVINEELGNQAEIATSYNSIGNIHNYRSEYDEALDWYQKALAIYEELGTQVGIFESSHNIGLIHSRRGEYDIAVKWFQKSLAISKEIGTPIGISSSNSSIGIIHLYQGEYDAALECFQKSLIIYEELGNLSGMASCYDSIGVIHNAQGNYDVSLEWYEKSLAIYEQLEHRVGMASNCLNIGRTFHNQSECDDALWWYQKSLFFQEELGNLSAIALSYNNIGAIHYDLDKHDEALANFQQGLKLIQKVNEPDTERLLQKNIGNTYVFGFKNHVDAYPHYKRAIDLLEQVRSHIKVEESQMSYLAGKENVYVNMILTCLALNRPEKAVVYAERGKSRALLDMLANARLNLDNADQALINRKAELERLINALERQQHNPQSPVTDRSISQSVPQPSAKITKSQVENISARLSEFNTELSRVNRQIKGSAKEWATMEVVPPVDFETLRQQIQKGSENTGECVLLIEFFIAGDEIITFLLPAYNGPPSIIVERLDWPKAELQKWLPDLLQKMAFQDKDLKEDLIQLHNRLIAPWLNTVNSWPERHKPSLLHFVPHGSLHALPLHAAYNETQERFLIEAYPIAYTPAASLLHFWQSPEKRDRMPINSPSLDNTSEFKALVYGNPTGDLLQAEIEAQSVAQIWETQPYLREAAQKAPLLDSATPIVADKSVLHLACHGVFDFDNPILTHLRLADHERLDLNEILSLPLNQADLVVLSACQSAVSEQGGGDELIGLTRSFLYAGTPSIIASLWNVNDQSTRELMTSFYNHWRNGGMNKARALQQAQIDYLRYYRDESPKRKNARFRHYHPYYWAAFVLVGDWL